MTENSGNFFEQPKSVMKKTGFLPSAFMPYVVLSWQFPFKYRLDDSGVQAPYFCVLVFAAEKKRTGE